jgi:hypothetical protein
MEPTMKQKCKQFKLFLSDEDIETFRKWADDDFTTLSGLMRKIISQEKCRRESEVSK